MQKIRVLVVDDSTVVRRLVSDALASDPELEVVGTAVNGEVALDKLATLNPDVVTLDIEMPEMDGLTALSQMRKSHPKLPVIMFSSLTQKGAVDTIQALALGASDYVPKPTDAGSVIAGMTAVKKELVPRIKALCSRILLGDAPAERFNPVPKRIGLRPQGKPELLAIGVSTGGPNALTALFKQLPGDFPIPIVIVQHMPPVFTRYLAERLDAVSPLQVREATGGEMLRPGSVWLAPGNFHMSVTPCYDGWMTRLNQTPPENSCRPAVDVLFRSVAEVAGAGSLAVVLTGMGQDGLRGCEAICDAGGRTLVQDEASSVVWGMPGAVAKAGLADQILPLDRLAFELTRLCRRPTTTRLASIK